MRCTGRADAKSYRPHESRKARWSRSRDVRHILRKRSGWTIIEMLIVVVIMAIVAAIVYPHFALATKDADENKHRAQLKLIREQISLYQAQHGEALPNLIHSWDDLTTQTTYKGRLYGPYLPQVPLNHKRSNVFDGNNVDPPAEYGFVYDYRGGGGTGMIYATNGSGRILHKW
jgi:prepilin-type N-terminal cleavage/methylation domain-containing protein